MRTLLLPAAVALILSGCSTTSSCSKVSDLEKKVANSTGTARELNIEELEATKRRCQEDLAEAGKNNSMFRDQTRMERARELKQAETGR